MKIDYEYLIDFKPVWHDDMLKCSKFEITTNFDTYTTIWQYEDIVSDVFGVLYRKYKNNLKKYCKILDINMSYYKHGKIPKRPFRKKRDK